MIVETFRQTRTVALPKSLREQSSQFRGVLQAAPFLKSPRMKGQNGLEQMRILTPNAEL